MDPQFQLNGLIGVVALTGSFLSVFNNFSSVESSEEEEPEWFFIASTHRIPEEARK